MKAGEGVEKREPSCTVGGNVNWGSHSGELYEVKSLSRVQLFATPWTVAYQAPPSMGFSRQEYWSGLPFPSPGDLPDPGIEPRSPALEADALTSEPPGQRKINIKSITSPCGIFKNVIQMNLFKKQK